MREWVPLQRCHNDLPRGRSPGGDVDCHARSGQIMPFLARLIDLYSLVVLVTVILSWLPLERRNPLVALARGLTEPVLAPIRRVLPPMGGLDLSPLVLLIGLQILRGLVV